MILRVEVRLGKVQYMPKGQLQSWLLNSAAQAKR